MNNLISQYDNLDKKHKDLVKIISLVYIIEELTEQNLIETIYKYSKNKTAKKSIKKIINDLIFKKIIYYSDDYDEKIHCSKTIMLRAIRDFFIELNEKNNDDDLLLLTISSNIVSNIIEKAHYHYYGISYDLLKSNNIRNITLTLNNNDYKDTDEDEIKTFQFDYIKTLQLNYSQDIIDDKYITWANNLNNKNITILCTIYLNNFDLFLTTSKELIQYWIEIYKTKFDISICPNFLLGDALSIDLNLQRFDDLKEKLIKLETLSQGCTKKSPYIQETLGALAFFARDFQNALKYYNASLKLFRKEYNDINFFRLGFHGIIYVMLRLIVEDDYKKIKYKIERSNKEEFGCCCIAKSAMELMFNYFASSRNSKDIAHTAKSILELKYTNINEEDSFIIALIYALYVIATVQHDSTQEIDKNILTIMSNYFYNNQDIRPLSAHLYAEILNFYCTNSTNHNINKKLQDDLKNFLSKNKEGQLSIIELLLAKGSWEKIIYKMTNVLCDPIENNNNSKKPISGSTRLIWMIDLERLIVTPVEQRIYKTSRRWKNKKIIPINQLCDKLETFTYLTKQDINVIETIRKEQNKYSWKEDYSYYFDTKNTLKALVSHPLIFDENNTKSKIELLSGELALHIEELENHYSVFLSHRPNSRNIIFEKITNNKYMLISPGKNISTIFSIIPKEGLLLPKNAKDQILKLINSIGPKIKIISNIEDDSLPTINGDTTITVNIAPDGENFDVRFLVRPLQNNGNYYQPGKGHKTTFVTDTTDNKRKKLISGLSETKFRK